jgi:L-ascorbate oxidase
MKPIDPTIANRIDRRRFIASAGGAMASAAAAGLFPAWARSGTAGIATGEVLTGETIALTIGDSHFATGGRSGHAVTVNGTLPAPLIRLREGQNVRIAVTNRLAEQSSIHWHGLILPFQMDGVPGVSFPGIDPGQTFTYEFPVVQSGTYWYHSHSGMQEAMGLYGPIVIDPAGGASDYDREHVLVLSDWTTMHPHEQLRRLKIMGGYFNHQRRPWRDCWRARTSPRPNAASGRRCGWTRPTFRTSPAQPIISWSTAMTVPRTGPDCSHLASGCACASSMQPP